MRLEGTRFQLGALLSQTKLDAIVRKKRKYISGSQVETLAAVPERKVDVPYLGKDRSLSASLLWDE